MFQYCVRKMQDFVCSRVKNENLKVGVFALRDVLFVFSNFPAWVWRASLLLFLQPRRGIYWLLPIFGHCRFVAYHKRTALDKVAPPMNGLKKTFPYRECVVPTCFNTTGEDRVAFSDSSM